MRLAGFFHKSKKGFFKGSLSLKRNIQIKENWTKVCAFAIISSLQNIDDEKNGYFRRSGQSDSVCQLSRQLLCILPLCVASVRGKSYSVFDFFFSFFNFKSLCVASMRGKQHFVFNFNPILDECHGIPTFEGYISHPCQKVMHSFMLNLFAQTPSLLSVSTLPNQTFYNSPSICL